MNDNVLELIGTSLIPVVAYGLKKFIDYRVKKRGVEDSPPLTEHPFFERMKCLRNNIVYSFKLENKGKEAIFRDILLHEFNIFIAKMWSLCKNIDETKELSDSEFYNLVMDTFRECVKEFSAYYKVNPTEYTLDEVKCIELVLGKFNKWNFPRIDSSSKSIEMISNSKFYTSNIVRMASILDMLLGQFVDTLNDAECTLGELNGDLKGLEFKGIKL